MVSYLPPPPAPVEAPMPSKPLPKKSPPTDPVPLITDPPVPNNTFSEPISRLAARCIIATPTDTGDSKVKVPLEIHSRARFSMYSNEFELSSEAGKMAI